MGSLEMPSLSWGCQVPVLPIQGQAQQSLHQIFKEIENIGDQEGGPDSGLLTDTSKF